jgi:hypothetical protein
LGIVSARIGGSHLSEKWTQLFENGWRGNGLSWQMSTRGCHTSDPQQGFFIVDIPAVWWIELPGIQLLGVVSLMIGLAFLGMGVRRIYSIKAVIDQQPV